MMRRTIIICIACDYCVFITHFFQLVHKHFSHLDVWQHVDENKAKPVMFIATDNMKVFVKYTVTIHHFIGMQAKQMEGGARGKAAVEIVESM